MNITILKGDFETFCPIICNYYNDATNKCHYHCSPNEDFENGDKVIEPTESNCPLLARLITDDEFVALMKAMKPMD